MTNNNRIPLIVKVYYGAVKLLKLMQRLTNALNVGLKTCHMGFWLGALNRTALYAIDQREYDRSDLYKFADHNLRGLFEWERLIIDRFFQGCTTLLVTSVGGGREALALGTAGFRVKGVECNPVLVGVANELLTAAGLNPDVDYVPRDQAPDSTTVYDGLIVGWGSYTLIKGRATRVSFLTKLRTTVGKDAPVLLSFFTRPGNSLRFRAVAAIGNVVRLLSRVERVEPGDTLDPNFQHYFSREEIESELAAAGFTLVHFATKDYGHAVAVAE